jgi:hypothetical protein
MRRRDAEAFHVEQPEATRTGSDDATARVSEPGRIERTSVAVATARVQPLADGQQTPMNTRRSTGRLSAPREYQRERPRDAHAHRDLSTSPCRRVDIFRSAQGASPSDGDGATFARRDRSSRILVFAEIALRSGSCFSAGRATQVMQARRSAGGKARRGKSPVVEGERSTAASA